MATLAAIKGKVPLMTLRDRVNFRGLQKLSMALMLPLAILPAAGICSGAGRQLQHPDPGRGGLGGVRQPAHPVRPGHRRRADR